MEMWGLCNQADKANRDNWSIEETLQCSNKMYILIYLSQSK